MTDTNQASETDAVEEALNYSSLFEHNSSREILCMKTLASEVRRQRAEIAAMRSGEVFGYARPFQGGYDSTTLVTPPLKRAAAIGSLADACTIPLYLSSVPASVVEALWQAQQALESAAAFIRSKHGLENPSRNTAIKSVTAALSTLTNGAKE